MQQEAFFVNIWRPEDFGDPVNVEGDIRRMESEIRMFAKRDLSNGCITTPEIFDFIKTFYLHRIMMIRKEWMYGNEEDFCMQSEDLANTELVDLYFNLFKQAYDLRKYPPSKPGVLENSILDLLCEVKGEIQLELGASIARNELPKSITLASQIFDYQNELFSLLLNIQRIEDAMKDTEYIEKQTGVNGILQ